MTKIVPTALLAQRAVIAVSKVLNSAGAVAESIKHDFGEDLIVQTQLGDTADSFSILIQVKGTRLKLGRDGKLRYRMDVEHLLRWVSHYQPVIVCVYDDSTELIYSFLPRAHFSLWKLATTKSKSATILLGDDEVFSDESAKIFIWKCRINYYQRMLSWYEDMQRDTHYLANHSVKKRLRDLEQEKGVVAFDFLKSIGLVQNESMDPEFVQSVEKCSKNFQRSNAETQDDKLTLDDVFVLCLMAQVDRKVGCGLPARLMTYSAHIAGSYFSLLHPSLWNEAKRRLATDVENASP